MTIEQLVRDMAASLGSDWLTETPFQMGELRIEKVGFAEVPLVFVMVACPANAITAMVPVVRQFVFRELEAARIENRIVEITPYGGNDTAAQGLSIATNIAPRRGRTKWDGCIALASRSSLSSLAISSGAVFVSKWGKYP